MRVNIKPLSVNDAWQGRRFKSDKYKVYEFALLLILRPLTLPDAPYEAFYTFGLSSIQSDFDNPVKPLQDILSKKYKFNDKLIMKATIEKIKVDKGHEFIDFEFKHYEKSH